RLALPAGRQDHDLAAGEAHRGVEIDRLGEILQIAVLLRDLDNPFERAPCDAQPAAGLLRDAAERLQPRDVGSESGDQHALARMAVNLLEQPAIDLAFRARRRRVEYIGRIAD